MRTFVTAVLRLSYRTIRGTPPSRAKPRTCASSHDSCAACAYARWNPIVEYDARITNNCNVIFCPPITATKLPQSTSASAPGACVCGTITADTSTAASSARNSATTDRTRDAEIFTSCSAPRRSQIRFAV